MRLLPLDFRLAFAYADSDVLRNSETKAVRSGVQTMPAGRACRCSSIPFPVHCGRLPSVRRTAPVSPLRGCPGNASSFGGEAGTSGAKLSWPLPRLLDGPGLVDSQRLVPVRGWGAGGAAGGPSQSGMCAFISRAPHSLPQPLGHGRRTFLRPVFSQCPAENMARATMAASMCF